MGLRSQMWKVVDWRDDTNDTLVHRFTMPNEKWEIMSGSKLTVRESQVAVFVNKGEIADVFGPGQYTLSTGNLPLLSGMRSLLYQGREVVIKSDVYFINTKQFTNQKWGTQNPVLMRDSDFGMIRLKAFGTYAFKVSDAGKLLKELFGTNSTFTTSDINNHLKSLIVSQLSDTIAESKIGVLDMAANLQEFSVKVTKYVQDKFNELGLAITAFIIENVSLPEAVEKALDERTQLGILGDKMGTYAQKKAADALGDAAKNQGSIGAFMGVGMGQMFGNASATAFSNIANAKDADQDKKEAPKSFCTKCGAQIAVGAKFCPECGEKLVSKNKCPQCGTEAAPGKKFCHNCGTKL
jgi:membrane protease subunit (stomatin/prohibitin family)